jgi:hypothetical protein
MASSTSNHSSQSQRNGGSRLSNTARFVSPFSHSSLPHRLLTDLAGQQLKKVINRVASELKDLGLTSEVLKELLENHQRASNSPPSSSSALPATHATPPTAQANGHVRWSDSEDDGKNAGSEARIEEVIDEAEGVVLEGEEGEGMSEKKKGKQSAEGKGVRKRRVRATYELAGAFFRRIFPSLRYVSVLERRSCRSWYRKTLY